MRIGHESRECAAGDELDLDKERVMADQPVRTQLQGTLAWSRKCLLEVIEGYPADRVCYQPSPADNHLLWTLGHLATSDEWVLDMLKVPGSTIPASYAKELFGYGSVPSPNAGDYPPIEEVRGHLDHARQRLLDQLGSMSDEQLAVELGEAGQGCVKDPAEAFAMTAWHEGWHTGQLSSIRRSLGMPPAFG